MYKKQLWKLFGNLAFIFLSNCFTLVMHRNHSIAQRPPLAPCISQNRQQSHASHLQGTACLHSWLNLRTHLSQLPLSLSPSISGPLDIPNIRLFAFTLPHTVTATSNIASWRLAFLQKELTCDWIVYVPVQCFPAVFTMFSWHSAI